MPGRRILIVDDEPGMLEVCRDTLQRLAGVDLVLESGGRRAAERLASESWDLLIADVRMPGVTGLDLLRSARGHDPGIPVLMITAFPTVDTAVEAMKLGAADYVTKPFLPEDLLVRVARLLDERRLRDESRVFERHVGRSWAFGEIIGKSAAMLEMFATMDRFAETETDVLILGETGTGKELVARSLHQRSRRNGGRFVPVDGGAIPEDLLESELFGHERGAFTGAHTRSLGLLELANRGTFFLDEVGELPPRLQSKLLRALQERAIRRVGGKDEIPLDVRIVAATARDLDQEMKAERFRSDLYYRINVARLAIPPLRDRADDVPLLADHFLERYGEEMAKPGMTIVPEAVEVLASYPWPGNVRELQNVIKRTMALARCDRITVDDLPDEIVAGAEHRASNGKEGFFELRERRVSAFAREYFTGLLHACRGDVTRAAEEARLPRGTLYRLLKKLDIDPEGFRR